MISLAVLILISILGSGEVEWWTNLSGCPLILRITKNERYIDIVNVGPRPASEYSLGCVASDGRGDWKFGRVVCRRQETLPPSGFASDTVAAMRDLQRKCGGDHWQLVVVEVRFDDGTVWRGKDSSRRAK